MKKINSIIVVGLFVGLATAGLQAADLPNVITVHVWNDSTKQIKQDMKFEVPYSLNDTIKKFAEKIVNALPDVAKPLEVKMLVSEGRNLLDYPSAFTLRAYFKIIKKPVDRMDVILVAREPSNEGAEDKRSAKEIYADAVLTVSNQLLDAYEAAGDQGLNAKARMTQKYRDLLLIYHPDKRRACNDSASNEEINEESKALTKVYKVLMKELE